MFSVYVKSNTLHEYIQIVIVKTHTTVPALGYLFEFYMSFASGYTANRQWVTICHNLQLNETVSAAIQDQLKADHGTRFIGWLLLHVMSIGNKGKMQMFYITFCAHFFGLSRQGIDLMARYGYAVSLDMFDEVRKNYIARSISTSK